MGTGRPPFRYDARLASEIELRWQDRRETGRDLPRGEPARRRVRRRPVRRFRGGVRAAKFYLLDFFPYPDFAALRSRTAIARIIELTAHASRLPRVPRALAEPLVLMVAPLVPHIAEELWQRLGHPSPQMLPRPVPP